MSTLTFYREPLRRNTGNWFDSFFQDLTFPRLTTDTTYPTTKVSETEAGYDVTLIAPGLSNEDFNVSLEGTTLTVSHEATTGGEASLVSYSSFTKSWTVPQGTTENDVHAQYKSGVLTLTVKKLTPDVPTAKLIPVQ